MPTSATLSTGPRSSKWKRLDSCLKGTGHSLSSREHRLAAPTCVLLRTANPLAAASWPRISRVATRRRRYHASGTSRCPFFALAPALHAKGAITGPLNLGSVDV
jgi:hypothetical protein